MNPSEEKLYSVIQQTYLPAHWDCCESNGQLVTPQEITGLPPWFAPRVCGWSGKPCSWKKTENWGRIQVLFCSAEIALAAVWMLRQSSEILEGSSWKGSGAHSLVIRRLFFNFSFFNSEGSSGFIHVAVSHTSFSRSLEMCVTCNMFVLYLCLGFFFS